MSFVVYDLSFFIIFSIIVAIILVLHRKRIKREGVFLLYRTSWGIKLIYYIAGKNKKFLNAFEWIVIVSGYILMIAGIYSFGQFIYIFLSNPEFVKLIKIPPIAPLIPYLPQLFKADYLPFFYFTYWIIVLAITAVVHEFFHGIFAKARDIKIKSTGFAFVGPFFGAFVEPDENKIKRMAKKPQIAFLSAGSFSNLLLGIIFFFVLMGFFFLTYTPSGVLFKDYSKSVINVSEITILNESLWNFTKIGYNGKNYYISSEAIKENYSLIYAYDDSPAFRVGLLGAIVEIDGKSIRTNSDLSNAIGSYKPEDKIKIKTEQNNQISDYSIVLGNNPFNETRAYLGISQINMEVINAQSSLFGKIKNKLVFFKDPNTYYKPKMFEELTIFSYNLIWWIVLVNFGVALFNMLPLGVADGGRVFYLTMLGIFRSEKIAKYLYKFMTYLILLSFIAITIFWFFNFR